MEPVSLLLEPWQEKDKHLTLAARLSHPDGRSIRLWWGLPSAWSDAATEWADPFVVGLLFPAMQWGRDVHVEGRVSPSLLANLETFMANWHAWVPDRYQVVQIRAREEMESPPPAQADQTVVPFSCGMDSCFTALRHRRNLMGRRNHNLAAGVLFHGFDIWLGQENSQAMYDGVLGRARILLDSLGMACIPMASNFHELPTIWGHSLGTHLVSGLSLLGRRFGHTLIPNEIPVIRLAQVSGSHPLNDPLLGSKHFTVQDDGGENLRYEKARLLSQWPEAMKHLRVCFENPGDHANCCRCEKCLYTILSFRAAGCPLPNAFPRNPANGQIARTKFRHEDGFWMWQDILRGAGKIGLADTDWARAVRSALRRNRVRRACKKVTRKFIPLRNAIRVVFRGSPLNRRELATKKLPGNA